MEKTTGPQSIPALIRDFVRGTKENARKNVPIAETDGSVSYLGVRLEKAANSNSVFVPKKEQYADYINDEFSLDLQKQLAVSFSLGDPMLIEGGTSIGKTTAVRKMAADLGWEVHYVNLNGATDVEDLMGRYIPNANKHSSQDPEYVFADGKVTSGLRSEEGKTKIIILDEFNSGAPNILIRLHEVLDAIGRGEDVVLSEDASQVIHVDKGKTKIVALQNPPGKGYIGREPLDPAQLRRWVYAKLPSDLPESTFSHSTDVMFALSPTLQEVPESSYLTSRDQVLVPEELKEIPGIKVVLAKYKEFHKAAKQLVKGRKIAADQPQPFTFDDRMEPRRVRDFILSFYKGDINETFQAALRYFYSNKLESVADKMTLEELISHVSYGKSESDATKRRGLHPPGGSIISPEKAAIGKKFTPEQVEDLRDRGYIILELKGNSIRENMDTKLISDREWHRGLPFINEPSYIGEVAVNADKFYIPASDNKSMLDRRLFIDNHSRNVARAIPGTRAIMGSASDYVELDIAYLWLMGTHLIDSQKEVMSSTMATHGSTNGNVSVGLFNTEISLSFWAVLMTKGVYTAPIIVPA